MKDGYATLVVAYAKDVVGPAKLPATVLEVRSTGRTGGTNEYKLPIEVLATDQEYCLRFKLKAGDEKPGRFWEMDIDEKPLAGKDVDAECVSSDFHGGACRFKAGTPGICKPPPMP